MGAGMILVLFFGAVVVFAVIFGMLAIGTYNALVTLRNRYENAFSQIDVQLKRRHDLIPNLVETVKGYMKHERDTLEAVIQARNVAIGAQKSAAANPGDPEAMRRLGGAEGALGGALSRLLVVAEAYPDLKADRNMATLQEELRTTENKVSFSRQAYNDAVTAYNTRREKFPANIVAGIFQFKEAHLFEIEEPEQREAPKVSFS